MKTCINKERMPKHTKSSGIYIIISNNCASSARTEDALARYRPSARRNSKALRFENRTKPCDKKLRYQTVGKRTSDLEISLSELEDILAYDGIPEDFDIFKHRAYTYILRLLDIYCEERNPFQRQAVKDSS